MTAALLLLLTAQLPEEGLSLRLETGDVFTETLDVQTTTRPAGDPEGPAVRSRYKLDLVTEVGAVGQSGATLRSRVEKIFAEIEPPGPGDPEDRKITYDSSERPDFDPFADEDRNQAAAEALRENWSPLKGSSLRRTVTPQNMYSEGDWAAVGEGDAAALAAAAAVSLTDSVSAPLPGGQLESWTDALTRTVGGEEREVTAVFTYDGRNSDGMDRIKVSMASAKDDPAALVGKGEVLFDRTLGRVVAYDAVIQAGTASEDGPAAVTRTNIAWRLQPVPEEEAATP